MKTHENFNLIPGFMIACSLCGSLIVLLMIVSTPTMVQGYSWQKPLFGSIFFLVCASGSLVAVSPRRCSMTHDTREPSGTREKADVKAGSQVSSEGHHPNCGRFRDHTIRFRGISYCAACSGLLAGSVGAMIVTALYFFLDFNSVFFGLPAVAIGLSGLGSGLIQSKLGSWIRSAANFFFVLGGSFMLIGVDHLIGSVFVDLFVTVLIILWILTRVMISRWDHHRICSGCGFLCVANRKVGVLASTTQTIQSADD